MYFVWGKKEESPKVSFYGEGKNHGTALPDWQIGSIEKIEGDSERKLETGDPKNKIPDEPLW